MKTQEYYSKATLKHRGWTDKAIGLFLKTHDKEANNPHFKSAPPMKLYLIKKVEDIEKNRYFQEFQNKNKVKIEGSKRAVETKREKILREINEWKMPIEKKDYQIILKTAINSYNSFKQEILLNDADFEFATENSDKDFLQRIVVNYLRHCLSDYDLKLENLFGKVGKKEAYHLLNKKIYDKIGEVYPQLKSECGRQLLRKQGICDETNNSI